MTVSILVPAYNIEKYIGPCLDSILSQSFGDFECIVVDDGSTDATPGICDEYAKKDGRIRVIHQENAGLSAARNTALAAASGVFIQCVDGDDLLEPGALEACVRALRRYDADAVCFDFWHFFSDEERVRCFSECAAEDTVYSVAQTPEILTFVYPSAWDKMIRRSLYTDHAVTWPEGYRFEDIGTTYRLLLHAKRIIYLHEPLISYRADNSASLMHRHDSGLLDLPEMIRFSIGYYREQGVYEKCYEEWRHIVYSTFLYRLQLFRQRGNRWDVSLLTGYYRWIRQEFPGFPKCEKYPIALPLRVRLFLFAARPVPAMKLLLHAVRVLSGR